MSILFVNGFLFLKKPSRLGKIILIDFFNSYQGENFVRFTGDTTKHATAQLFAWEAYEKGVDVHLLAEPTKLELLQKEYDKKKEQFKSKVQEDVLKKYGGEEHLQAPPKTLLLAQTEDYVEYSRSGKIIKGQEKEIIRSKYEEDVFINNHTSVWGSFWKGGQWGYKCCHSFIKNSYCLGEAGKNQAAAVPEATTTTTTIEEEKKASSSSSESDEETKKADARRSKKKDKKKKQKEKTKQKKKEKHEVDKLQEALKKEEAAQQEADELLAMNERKRPYNSMFEVKKPTEEEIEAYYLKRKREDDPMKDFM